MASSSSATPQSMVPARQQPTQEYLDCLVALSGELEKAMDAIAVNQLHSFEDSVSRQITLSGRLVELSTPMPGRSPIEADPAPAAHALDPSDNIGLRIAAAAQRLESLNQTYALLLQQSSDTVRMLTSLFRSHSGYTERGVPPPTLRTWSCQL